MAYAADSLAGCIDIATRSVRVSIVAGGGGGSVNYADAIVPSGTIDGVNATFTLPDAPSPAASLMLFMNGLCQIEGVDYLLSGVTITYANPPSIGDSLICWYRH